MACSHLVGAKADVARCNFDGAADSLHRLGGHRRIFSYFDDFNILR
jgi:hypothetical protein